MKTTDSSGNVPNADLTDYGSPSGEDQSDAPSAWLFRAGGQGEHSELFIEHGIAAVGFGQLADLSGVSSRDEVAELVGRDWPEASKAQVSGRANQLWALLSSVRRGDLVAMPRAASSQFALGTVTREYWYRHDSGTMRHTVSVDWKRTDVPRDALQEDLLKSLSYRRTVNKMKPDAARRLHQLLETGRDPGSPISNSPMSLTDLGDALLVDPAFLEDIVELLQDKGQVILYGPPGTGKTYLARELAKALAPGNACRALVQFHPSTSYEDFFEGYRPAGTGADGTIRYELTPGPLARMAERASAVPDQRHVMIIDEINRGNLPRVLGELLFLLEYRNESVQTLYRPEEPFSLPDNLWFIGTMNTADRSIALVDAALRRRFHFVPFFPDVEPMAGLLRRWLSSRNEPAWVGDLVDAVNMELKRELEGSHLLLGPSHFMKEYGPSPATQKERLRRIWKYNIEPFIEDQFFGDPDQISLFKFDSVIRRHAPSAGRSPDSEESPSSAGATQQPAASSDRELWASRASGFPPQDRAGSDKYHAELRRIVQQYVEFAQDRGVDPGKRDDQLVEELLSPYSESTKANYRHHLREWFDHAGSTWET